MCRLVVTRNRYYRRIIVNRGRFSISLPAFPLFRRLTFRVSSHLARTGLLTSATRAQSGMENALVSERGQLPLLLFRVLEDDAAGPGFI